MLVGVLGGAALRHPTAQTYKGEGLPGAPRPHARESLSSGLRRGLRFARSIPERPRHDMGIAVIFLDIDGVICCNMAGRLEEGKLAVLNSVAKATGAKVVLSTDWRRQAQLKRQVVAALKRLDIEVIGATPMKAMFQPIRPVEILEWMSANGSKSEVTSWVAIDDRDLLNEQGGQGLQGHMVRTHPNSGLTKRLGDMAIEVRADAEARDP